MNRSGVARGLLLGVIIIVIVAAGIGAVFLLYSSSSSSRYTGPTLVVGDYAQFTGKVVGGFIATNETIRLQVAAVNSTSVEWIQSQTVLGHTSQEVYWVPRGTSPFHFNRPNSTFTLVSSSDTVRLIGSKTYSVTAAVFNSSNGTSTYFYLRGTALFHSKCRGSLVA